MSETPQKPTRNRSSPRAAVVIVILVSMFLIFASERERATQPAPTVVNRPAELSPSHVVPANAAPDWDYNTSVDKLTDKATKSACLESDNTVTFGWPYGTVHGHICFRMSGGKLKDGFFHVDNGQILTGLDGIPLKLRCDDKPVEKYTMRESRTGESEFAFFDNAGKILGRVKGCQRVRLAMDFYNEGEGTFDFKTASFDPTDTASSRAAPAPRKGL